MAGRPCGKYKNRIIHKLDIRIHYLFTVNVRIPGTGNDTADEAANHSVLYPEANVIYINCTYIFCIIKFANSRQC